MENTPLLLWWEIAFSPFPFENFTADLARPGSKSKLGFSVLLQHWLCIDISHCFWNQPEKMSLCREQAEMSQKNRWAAWTIPWKQSRRGERFLTLPSLPQVCPLAPGSGKGEPWCHHNPSKGSSDHGWRKKEQPMNVTGDSVSCSWGSVCGKQRRDQRQQQLTDVWQHCSKGALAWWRQGREGGKEERRKGKTASKDQGGWSLFAGGWQEIFLQSNLPLGEWTRLSFSGKSDLPTFPHYFHISS